jgi:hypothetical protein
VGLLLFGFNFEDVAAGALRIAAAAASRILRARKTERQRLAGVKPAATKSKA